MHEQIINTKAPYNSPKFELLPVRSGQDVVYCSPLDPVMAEYFLYDDPIVFD